MKYDRFYELMMKGQEKMDPKYEIHYRTRMRKLYDLLDKKTLSEESIVSLALAFRAGADLGTDITARLHGDLAGQQLKDYREYSSNPTPSPIYVEPSKPDKFAPHCKKS